MNANFNINLNDGDVTAYQGLTGGDRQAFLIAKLSAQMSPALIKNLTAGASVIPLLSSADQTAISNLIAAVKAVQ